MKKNNSLKHILCIDDESDIREVAKMSLETIGDLKVTTLSSGKEAIEVVEKIKPDAILLDVMMPEMDGIATLQEIRKNKKLDHIPIILMTARVQISEIKSYINSGAAGVISKPFDPMKLSSEINQIFQKFHAN